MLAARREWVPIYPVSGGTRWYPRVPLQINRLHTESTRWRHESTVTHTMVLSSNTRWYNIVLSVPGTRVPACVYREKRLNHTRGWAVQGEHFFFATRTPSSQTDSLGLLEGNQGGSTTASKHYYLGGLTWMAMWNAVCLHKVKVESA